MRAAVDGSPRLTRRRALRLLGLGAGAAALASCAPTAGLATSPSPAQPRSGGRLRVLMASDIRALDAYSIQTGIFDTVWACADTLTRYDATLTPRPQLAESWDFSSDARQIKLNLRRGVTYHTGREFTSADVKYNIAKVKQPGVSAQLGTMAGW